MPLSESDTRAKLIDPALHARGWTEDLIRREETAGAVEIVEGQARKRSRGRVDYTLRVKVTSEAQPVAVALIEAKAESLPAAHGLEQAKLYAECKRLNVPFVIATNGHQFVLFDRITGITDKPKPMNEIPTPGELRAAYESGMGFSLESPTAKPLLVKYQGGEATRRYYQDAAIRAVLEHIARGEKLALLSLATGAGKTFIAVHLLKRIADAGLLRRALFICDRDELRAQGLAAMQNVFGADAAEVYRKADGTNNAKNARIHIATYQTLGIDEDDAGARHDPETVETEDRPAVPLRNFLTENYPEDFFSHIIIDECHRSAWGKWSQVLTRNPNAVQVGLTATPRKLMRKTSEVLAMSAQGTEGTAETSEASLQDAKITADNLKYFGEPVYEYDMTQGMEDGYLAACEVIQRDIFLDKKTETEQVTGVKRDEMDGKEIRDAITGEALSIAEVPQQRYEAGSFEGRLIMPDRVEAMCKDLFNLLVESGGPEQKTIIFCAKDSHADRVANEMNNLYREWRIANGLNPNADNHYAFKCTAASSGNDQLPDLRGSSQRYFVACTVDLLTTGVDVPIVRNVVFFKYVRSSIAFHQMVGRGTRLHPPSGKLMFRVFDYTDATRLFGKAFLTRTSLQSEKPRPGPKPHAIEVEGFEVAVTSAGHSILTMVDGRAMPVTVEEYKERLASRLVEQAPTLEAFRARWVNPPERADLLGALPDGARSATLVQKLGEMGEYDLYDVLAELGYGLAPKRRSERAEAFAYKHVAWLNGLPKAASVALQALASQFARAGTDGLENPHIFETPEVQKAGGLDSLRAMGRPADILRETKMRLFAV
jgi:type I restriction enzyme, R subunit